MRTYTYKLSVAIYVAVLFLLAACGGGGGSPGTVSGGTSSTATSTSSSTGSTSTSTTTAVAKSPILSVRLEDQAGSSTRFVAAAGTTRIKLKLTDPSGNALSDQVIEATSTSSNITFPSGSAVVTDSAGAATIAVARTSLSATGSGTIIINYSYRVGGSLLSYPDGSPVPTENKVISGSADYVLSASNISLSNFTVGLTASLPAYGTTAVKVLANVDGVVASSSPIQVNFVASCGTVTPATVTTNSTGFAETTYSAVNATDANDQGCSGRTITITASALNANSVSTSFQVATAPATNLLFVDATPSTIYLANSGGDTQSVVKFRLVNSSNKALQGQNIVLALKDLGSTATPRVAFGSVGNTADIVNSTDASGEVSVPVFSGNIPTSAVVTATLQSNTAIKTTSRILSIQSGRPVQSRASLSVDKFSAEAYGVDGVGIVLTMRLADRQGNPVPDGTAVNFVTENGVMKPASCLTASSLCTSTLSSQGARPTNGLVSVMAYTPGEEDFIDLNSDNEYTAGEPFTDLGNAFRDDAATSSGANGTYVAGSFQLPRSGSTTCTGGYAGRPNTCDGVWGAVDVRRTFVVVWATSEANITNPTWTRAADGNYNGSPIVATQLAVDISDTIGNAMPDGSTISVSATDKTPLAPALTGANGAISYFSCSATFSGSALKSTILPTKAIFSLNTCVAGDKIEVTVTAPSGTKTTQPFTVP